MPDRTTPHAPEAEISVLGACLMDPDAVESAVEMLDENTFYAERNRTVFRAVLALHQRGQPVEPVTVSEEMRAAGTLERAGGMAYIAELLDAVPTAANVEYHARIVQDRAVERALLKAAQEIAADCMSGGKRSVSEKVDRAAERVFALSVATDAGGPVAVRRILSTTIEHIEQVQEAGGGVTGIGTGLKDLDDMTGGYQRGDMSILAARPGMGKTSRAVGSALHAAIREQTGVVIYSYEMSKEQMVQRMLAHEATVNLKHLLRGGLTSDEYVALAHTAGVLDKAPIWVEDRGDLSVMQVRAMTRRLKRQRPELGLVILDYIQLMGGSGDEENRNRELSIISRSLKLMAKELDVHVMALSQLSREPDKRADHRPHLSDLRESGALEQDADLVMFLFRPERYMTPAEIAKEGADGKAEIIVAKQRNGPVGTIDAYFRKEAARYEDLAPAWRAA